MRDGGLNKKRKAMPLSHSPTAEPREALVPGALSHGSPGLVRRALRKVLGSAESVGRGQESETRSDRPPHLDAHRFRAPAPSRNMRRLSLALQGGGAFGAFTWGVLDRLLEEDELKLDAVSGASAGAINAVLLASGLAKGSPDDARASLERFWTSVAQSSAKNLFLHPELVAATASQLSPSQ